MSFILVTGSAGFIGSHVSKKLLNNGRDVIGIDNLNDYYDVKLKKDRLKDIKAVNTSSKFIFYNADISDLDALQQIFAKHKIESIINLAAQAGVRHSIINPHSYVNSNIVGFTNILEISRHEGVNHLTYASTSSIYGADRNYPFNESRGSNHPVQFYAATKKANEVMAHSYSHLYELPTSGLRFFTVYGPWGRPDMALFIFTKLILENKPIPIFNNGMHKRDFTYIDDLVDAVIKIHENPPKKNDLYDHTAEDPSQSSAPYRIINIGSNNPINLSEYIECIESTLGMKAIKKFEPMQDGDVETTFADIEKLKQLTEFNVTPIEFGIKKFVSWYRNYYHV